MITLISNPYSVHTSDNDNYFVWESDLRFFPQYNQLTVIVDENGNVYNRQLIPANPDGFSTLNAKNIIEDYVVTDNNWNITNPTASTSIRQYKIHSNENFEGLYITASSAAGLLSVLYVSNNTSLLNIATGSLVDEIGLASGVITTSPLYVYSYATASNGYINRITISANQYTFVSPSGSAVNSEGYIIIDGYSAFSNGPTYSGSFFTALKGSVDYLDYNQSNNFASYYLTQSTSKFLTNAPAVQWIGSNEWGTLSLINNYLSGNLEIIDNLGNTYSKSIPIGLNDALRIDVPVGTANLGINANATSYTVRVRQGATGSYYSEEKTYKIKCMNGSDFRLCWLNNLGGIDYYTFQFNESSQKRINRASFDRSLNYNSVKSDRGMTTYMSENYDVFTVNSTILTNEESNWLSQLSTSKEVWWIRNNELIPITLGPIGSGGIVSDTYNRNVSIYSEPISITFRLSRTSNR